MQNLPIAIDALKRWFLDAKRDLPWRENPTPYGVWISEVMLQQTQVAVVIAYYDKWMQKFPTIEHLAQASLEEVVKLWEGLGYYSRARSLHRAAQYLIAHHGGSLPSSREELEKIPGLGPYTVGAILSFAFHQKAAAVDANVIRVLTRLGAWEGEVTSGATKKWVWDYAERLLPEREPWLVVEGLIELGATVCTRQPKCCVCPLFSDCLGRKKGIADLLPVKTKKVPVTVLKRQVAVVAHEGCFLVGKGKQGSIMADLYEFPYMEAEDQEDLHTLLGDTFQLETCFIAALSTVQHSFTRYRATLYPSLWQAAARSAVEGYEWVPFSDLEQLPFSAGHRRITHGLKSRYAHTAH